MIKFFTSFRGAFLLCLILTGCQKKDFDSFYERPSTLEPPIYQQLQARNNFTRLLVCIDKAGYKDILSKAGYWTFFAPNDAAFAKFMTKNNIADIKDINDSLARSIVKFGLVYNAYRSDQLSTYQTAGGDEVGANMAFKRKTAYYDWVKEGPAPYKKIVATNRNSGTKKASSLSTAILNDFKYVNGDNNNKYIPYFTGGYFAKNSLSPTDYSFFYPEGKYTAFNVAGASVVTPDIAAENGFIHEIDEVILPLPSFDQYMSSTSQYSDFRKLLDSVSVYVSNVDLTHRNFVLTGSTDSVYIKSYNGQLAFSPNNENYQVPFTSSFINTESQRTGYTMMVPNNAVLQAYRKKLLANYGGSFFKTAPSSLVYDLINSCMMPESIWPSKFTSSENVQAELPTIPLTNVVDRKILSNGFFYGLDKMHEANVFRTVYSIPYLDPHYGITLLAYNESVTGIKPMITQPTVKFTLLITPDDVLTAAGWRYNEASITSSTTAWGYKAPTSSSYSHSSINRDIILRYIKTGVLPGDLVSLSGEGIVEALNGEYIKYKNGKIQTSGTVDSGVDLDVVKGPTTAYNGSAFFLSGLLAYTEKNVGEHLEKLATKYPSSYSSFFWFVSNSNLYNKTTKAINGVNAGADNNYTILCPDNAAITQAIKDGLLPGTKATGALPTAAPTSESDKDLLRKFILYHIINGTTVAADGKKSDSFITLLQTEAGDNTLVNVLNDVGQMRITDNKGRQATVSVAVSNQLSNRTLIHSINSYLNYNK
ncbi:fasciclin domain-containing protein [Mucilaginibacter yixingensis]|uniref:Fasciclin domain-containing protein n=1 Tax=Mucilaginibacter yixingensis TaxID=1295612 RepID=A0A2T5JG70_9SPHI|nr:fasciclin domain-containing protein [Mucilaginibacter yixingensis]PTR01430.1 fasciclin domain-containing protein [Mucilaginibacter yixingensis]